MNNIEKIYPFVVEDNVSGSLNQIIYKVGNLCIGQIFFQCIGAVGEYGTVLRMSMLPKETTYGKIFDASYASKPTSYTLQKTGFMTLDALHSLENGRFYMTYVFFLINT